MNLTKCSKGHFYDADRYEACPHCNANAALGITQDGTAVGEDEQFPGGGKTIPDPAILKEKEPNKAKDEFKNVTKTCTPGISDEQKTISKYSIMNKENESLQPVVGWLVCIEGNHFGEDFRLITGRNFIGRNPSMEICLSGDNSISRDKHLIIVFEPKTNTYLVQPGDSKELSYLNDEVILQPKELKIYDIISMGNSKCMFIPFCTQDNN